MSGETVRLYDSMDKFLDVLVLPPGYMEGAETRSVVVEGKVYIEGGRPNSFYAKGQFAEVPA